MNHCPVMSDLDRWHNKHADDDAKTEAIEAEAERLMSQGEEFYPWTPANVAEAMGEIAAAVGPEIDRITTNYALGSVCTAGAVLNYAIRGYWRRMATEKAEQTVLLSWNSSNEQEPEDRRDYELDR